MHMRRTIFLAGLLGICVLPLVATAPVPRKSPELKYLDRSEKETLLTSFKGKVVVIEFMLVGCPHCLRVALTIDRVNSELSPRGFQPLGIVFDNGMNGPVVSNFAQQMKLSFPVGYTSSDKVDAFLGREAAERLQVPQIVVIDRQGIIRAQSHPVREVDLENESYLRNLIESLIRESVPNRSRKQVGSH